MVSVKRRRLEELVETSSKHIIIVNPDIITKECINWWKLYVNWQYPSYQAKTYIKPPVHFNRVPYTLQTVGGLDVRIPTAGTQHSDIREDEAFQRLHNVFVDLFSKLSPPEPAFVLFQLDFDNYLNYDSWRECLAGLAADSAEGSTSGTRSLAPATPSSATLARADLALFRRPRNLHVSLQRGSFDVLIVHRKLGLIVLKVRTIGDTFGLSEQLQGLTLQRAAIRQKLVRTLRQLNKEEEVLKELFEDVREGRALPVTKGLVFANLRRQSFAVAVLEEPELVNLFAQRLGAHSFEAALEKCIFSEQLPPIGRSVDVTDDVITGLKSDWWEKIAGAPSVGSLSCELYESVIARLCGPATRQYVTTARVKLVDVPTLSAAVLHTSLCFTDPVLTSDLVEKLQACQDHQQVYVTGPPGTGKSLLLTLKAVDFVQRGGRVVVVSLWHGSELASLLLHQKIAAKLTDLEQSSVHLITSDSGSVSLLDIQEEIINVGNRTRVPLQRETTPVASEDSVVAAPTLTADSLLLPQTLPASPQRLAQPGKGRAAEVQQRHQIWTQGGQGSCPGILLLVDEAPWFLEPFVQRLLSVTSAPQAPGRSSSAQPSLPALLPIIWAASAVKSWRPERFAEMTLQRCLRCPPTVVKEMMQRPAYVTFARERYASLDVGVISGAPSPTDGPRVRRLSHESHGFDGSGGWGRGKGEGDSSWHCYQCGHAVANFLLKELRISRTSEKNDDPILRFCDVIVSGYVDCDEASSAFLQGLRDAQVGYDLIAKGDKLGPSRLASPPAVDKLQVAECESVMGLERAVVVVLGTRDVRETCPRPVDPVFDVMGRCTSQLVLVGL